MELSPVGRKWKPLEIGKDPKRLHRYVRSWDSVLIIGAISKISLLEQPLMNRLLEAGQAFMWTDECEQAFLDLKTVLTGEEVMALPQDTGLFILDTDASDRGVGGVLSQMQWCEQTGREEERPVHMLVSRLLSHNASIV